MANGLVKAIIATRQALAEIDDRSEELQAEWRRLETIAEKVGDFTAMEASWDPEVPGK